MVQFYQFRILASPHQQGVSSFLYNNIVRAVFHSRGVTRSSQSVVKSRCIASWKAGGICLMTSFGTPSSPGAFLPGNRSLAWSYMPLVYKLPMQKDGGILSDTFGKVKWSYVPVSSWSSHGSCSPKVGCTVAVLVCLKCCSVAPRMSTVSVLNEPSSMTTYRVQFVVAALSREETPMDLFGAVS